jgi:hypothetical protein
MQKHDRMKCARQLERRFDAAHPISSSC